MKKRIDFGIIATHPAYSYTETVIRTAEGRIFSIFSTLRGKHEN